MTVFYLILQIRVQFHVGVFARCETENLSIVRKTSHISIFIFFPLFLKVLETFEFLISLDMHSIVFYMKRSIPQGGK